MNHIADVCPLDFAGKNREKMEPLKADQTRLSETFIDQPEGG